MGLKGHSGGSLDKDCGTPDRSWAVRFRMPSLQLVCEKGAQQQRQEDDRALQFTSRCRKFKLVIEGGGSAGRPSVKLPEPRPSLRERLPLPLLLEATGRWAEERVLGSGAFGTVYRAQDPSNPDATWAVKRARLQSHTFKREVEAMLGLRHPHVVRLLGFCSEYDAQAEAQEQVLVYEFVSGGDLNRRMKAEPPLSLSQRLDILLGTARGLEYLHSNGIVHRDVKPSNVLLDENLQPKLADFGLLREIEGSSVGVTAIVGTPGYVDPAYISTRRAIPSSDVYSFGVLALELLTGHDVVLDGGSGNDHIKKWAEPLILARDVTALKDPHITGPDAVVLQVAELALSCMSLPTATRPQMKEAVAELESLKVTCSGRSLDQRSLKVDRSLRSASGSYDDLAREVNELRSRESMSSWRTDTTEESE